MSYTTIVLEEICRVCNNYYDKDETTWCDDGLICKGCFEGKLVEMDCGGTTRRLCKNKYCKVCYNRSFLSSERSKNWSEKNDKNPREVFKGSRKLINFNCKCGHIFNSLLSSIKRGGSCCPFCSSKKLCSNKDCNFCFQKSFASHIQSQLWSDKNKETPRECFKCSNKKYLFNCNECGHIFYCCLTEVVRGRWCNFCSSTKLCINNDCKFCFQKSFASHIQSQLWSDKNKETPRECFKCSNKKYLFDCGNCNHEFFSVINNITNGSSCPFCNSKKLCSNKDCNFCFQKSFASLIQSQFWSDKNKETPRECFKGSDKKHFFNCGECKSEFNSTLNNINLNNSWCPHCKNKTELKIFTFLKEFYNTTTQKKLDNCKNIKHLQFDFCIDDKKLIIELDGLQHFKDVSHFRTSSDNNRKRDVYKMKCALDEGYSIIRLIQKDIWNDKYNWKTGIKPIIDTFPQSEPKVIFYEGNNSTSLYESHKNELDQILKDYIPSPDEEI